MENYFIGTHGDRSSVRLRAENGIVYMDVGLDGTKLRTLMIYIGSEEVANQIVSGGKKFTPGSKFVTGALRSVASNTNY